MEPSTSSRSRSILRRIGGAVFALALVVLAGAVPAYLDSRSRQAPESSEDTPAEMALERDLAAVDKLIAAAAARLEEAAKPATTTPEAALSALASVRRIDETSRAVASEWVRRGRADIARAAILTAAADSCVGAAEALSAVYVGFSERVAYLKASGKDVTVSEPLVATAKSRLAAATSQASDARRILDAILSGDADQDGRSVADATVHVKAAAREIETARDEADEARAYLP